MSDFRTDRNLVLIREPGKASTVATFWDVDGTLIDEKTGILATISLAWRYSVLRWIALVSSLPLVLLVVIAVDFFNRYWAQKILLAVCFRGLPVAEVHSFMEEFVVGHMKSKVIIDSYQRLKKHKEEGHSVFLVSGSPHAFILPFAIAIGAHGVVCTQLEVVPNKQSPYFSGWTDLSMVGVNKSLAVKRVLDSMAVLPEHCHAYGDHFSDAAILSMVGYPVAVRPDRRLRMLAVTNGWEIIEGQGKGIKSY